MRAVFGLIVAVTLSGCVDLAGFPNAPPVAVLQPVSVQYPVNFAAVVRRIEPVAEQMCRQQAPRANCDFRIVVDSRPGQPPNAYQTVNVLGRPVIGFTVALIARAYNDDELAFVMGHEAAHHISGHLEKKQNTALAGAVLGGLLATLVGGSAADVDLAQNLGGSVGARSYSKEFELAADRLGTIISYRAGYDPLIGAQFFSRIPDPGDRFLGTHPPNAARISIVKTTMEGLS